MAWPFRNKSQPVHFFKRIDVPAIAAGALKEYDRENTLRHFRKFAPYSNFHLVNDSQVSLDIVFDYNPDRSIKVIAGGTGDSKNQPFSSFTIENLDAATSTDAGEVFLQIETIR